MDYIVKKILFTFKGPKGQRKRQNGNMCGLTQTWAIFFFCKGPDSKSFRLCGAIRSLYQFPRAAVKKYHKFDGLNQQKFSLSVLEARSMAVRCRQGHAASEVLGRHLFPASLPASGGCWLHLAPLSRSCIPLSLPSTSPGPFSCLSVRLCIQIPVFYLIKRPVIGFEAHPNLL